ncbi:MAG: hypothetical protein HY677_04810, partial [Chloroflexi bacterium]|nr:hypothetical protein [Chloroflexota bacterium]
ASGLVTFAIQGVSGRDASAQLWERGSVVARPVAFPEGVRLSIDFFNTEEEVARVLDVVRDLAVHGYAPAEGRGIDIDKDL